MNQMQETDLPIRVYETLLSHTPDLVYVIGLDKRFVYANKALLRMWGKEHADIAGKSLIELGYEDWHAEMHEREVDEVVATGRPIRGKVPFNGTDGRRIYDYIFAPMFDENGRVTAIAGTTRDATDHEETLEALQRSEMRMNLALEASDFIGTWDWDLQTNRIISDERFARLYSVDPAQAMQGVTLEEFITSVHPDDLARITPAIDQVITHGGRYDQEYRLLQSDGSLRWVAASGRSHLNENGKPIRFAGVAIDITDRKRMQAVAESQNRALELAARDAPLEETLNILIHSVEEQLPGSVRASVLLVSQDGKHLQHGAAPSLPASYNQIVDDIAIGEQMGSCGAAAYLKAMVIASDIATDPRWADFKDIALAHQLRACWSKPIFSSQHEVLGTFAIYYSEPRTPTLAEREALIFMARTAGILIERERLIAERRQAETSLRESRHELQQMNDAIPQQVWTARPNGTLDYANRHAYDYVGNRMQPDGTLDWASVIHPDDALRSARVWAESLASGRPYQVEQRIRHAPSGAYRWNLSRALPIRNEAGDIIKWYGTNTDIEEQKRAAESVAEAKAHLSLMVESARDYAILSSDAQGVITSWNSGAERVFGFRPEDVIGQHVRVLFTPEDRDAGTPEYEILLAAEKGRATDERWHIRKNGERFYVSGIMAAMRDEAGKIRGFIKIARDMTQQQEAQQILIEARNAAESANIAKSEFLANMSHEIRTPMNAVIGLANILAMSQPLTQKQGDYIRTLQLSADSLLALINDLLDIAKIEAQTVELERIPIDLAQLMQEIVSMMNVRAREKGLVFHCHDACIRSRIFIGDPTRLRQIILNLCSNAVKFTETGSVSIDITCEPIDAASEMIHLAVRDSGTGIAPDKLKVIFQKFVQADTSINRKYGGTGLGLAITKTLTEIMGGTIEVQSTLGQGSVFTVHIPLQRGGGQDLRTNDLSLPALEEGMVAPSRGPRILLVEDYPANVLVARTFLENFGYVVDLAENGLEAIERIKAQDYALVLMDVQMHGMNGLETTQWIRQREKQMQGKRLPIIGMTAHALMGDRERCLSVGMDDYISKPFNPAELETKLSTWLATPPDRS